MLIREWNRFKRSPAIIVIATIVGIVGIVGVSTIIGRSTRGTVVVVIVIGIGITIIGGNSIASKQIKYGFDLSSHSFKFMLRMRDSIYSI